MKSLASQTSRATADIGDQIGAIQGGHAQVRRPDRHHRFDHRQALGLHAGDLGCARDQTMSTAEIAENAREAAASANRVGEAADTVRARSTGLNAAGAEMRPALGELAGQSTGLRTELDTFVSRLSSA